MPTASIKAEKEKQPPADANDPLRQGITIVEHKIRNLEKRKARLDSYRVLQSSGKELQPDQINAVQKYDEVIQTLDFARDLCKQLNTLSVESAKAIKKQLWKEAQERTKEILIIQDVLSNMGQDNIRDDLTNGRASVSLTAEELAQIDELFQELSPKAEEPPQPYVNQFQNCAEVMASLVEGKTKKAFGTTYSALKEKLLAIAASGIFDPVPPAAPAQPAAAAPPAPQAEEEPVVESLPEPTPAPPQQTSAPVAYTPNSAPPAAAVVPVMQEVSQVESALFQQQQYQQQQQFQQQQQPIQSQQQQQQQQQNLANLVFKSGSINFIQENEVDEPLDSSIPSQTFTNQNYVPSKGQPQQAPPPAGGDAPAEYQDEGWTPVGGEWNDRKDGMLQADDDGNEWQETNYHNNQSNDGFTPAGGGRGGRGRGGRGGRGNRGQPRPNSSNRGGYNRDGGYNREGGYNRGGGDYRGGEHKEGGYQNGVRERRGGRGGGGPDSRGRGRGGGGPRPPRRAGHQ